MEIIRQSIYDFPKYYDLVYGSDWKAECIFLKACFEKYATGDVKRLFEPACGTGRLLYRFGKKDYFVSGLDLNEKAIKYCNRRLEKHGIEGRALVGDMTDFNVDSLDKKLDEQFDASFNTINSFRHLNSHQAAVDHLKCMAATLRSGGLYVLGLHLSPTEVAPSEDEDWIAEGKNVQVNTRMWLTERSLEERFERFAIEFEIYTPEKFTRIEDELVFRTYTAPQFDELLNEVKELEVVDVFDFAYEIDNPISIDGKSEDVVYVLRRT